MRWSWNHAADECGSSLIPRSGSSPIIPGGAADGLADQLRAALADPFFRDKVDELVQTRRRAAEAPAWFQQHHAQAPLTAVTYFSMSLC